MKKLILGSLASALLVVGFSAHADAIVVKGVSTPTFTEVTLQNDVYVPATTVTPVSDYYFLNIDKTEKVCKTVAVSTITGDITPISVKMGDTTEKLYCYNRTYFTFE